MIVPAVKTARWNGIGEDTAASLTTGMILHVCYSAATEGRVACLADLAGQFTRPGIDFRETLNEMLSYPHDPALRRGWRTSSGLQTATHPVVSEKAQEMLDKKARNCLACFRRLRRHSHSIAIHLWPATRARAISPLTTS